ncbi:LuxR C-terminal-related transcriptional regulator [Desulfolithobacter sp.]
MNLIICSDRDPVRRRWQEPLSDRHEIFHASTLRDLDILLRETQPDLLLLHRTMVDLKTVGRICGNMTHCRLFVLSDRPDNDEGLALLRLGVVGYANTYIAPARLQEAVRVILTGSVWVGQQLMGHLIRTSIGEGKGASRSPETAAGSRRDRILPELSDREFQIASLVALGLTNPQIAHRLEITERTVKAHLSAIYAKTGTRGRLNLALLLHGTEQG